MRGTGNSEMKAIFKKLAYRLLGTVAKWVLKKYRPKIIAVSGSQGKTSTVEAIYRTLLPCVASLRRSFENYNSEWGVPASIIGEKFLGYPQGGLFKISWRGYWQVLRQGLKRWLFHQWDYPQYLVLEMALDRPGDLAYLTKIAPPDIAVLTNVSESHLGFFRDKEHLAKEKGQLLRGIREGGLAVLNADDPRTPQYRSELEGRRIKVITFGRSADADFRLEQVEQAQDYLRFRVSRRGESWAVVLPVLGRHFAWAGAAALAVASFLGCDLGKSTAALSSFRAAKHRMQKLLLGSFLVIDDTYNASYDSFREALWALNQLRGERRRVAIIGGIHELGKFAPEIHRRLGELLASQVDLVAMVGPEATWTKEGLLSANFPEDKIKVLAEGQAENALDLLEPGDAVLFKASRTRELDKLVEVLKQKVESRTQKVG